MPVTRDTSLTSSADQRAAMVDLQYWRPRLVEALSVTGTLELAARIAGIAPMTVYRAIRSDPTFAQQITDARARAGERVIGKVYRSVMGASREQIVKTPTAAIALVNWLRPDLRPNASTVNVAVAVNLVDRLSETRVREVASVAYDVPDSVPDDVSTLELE